MNSLFVDVWELLAVLLVEGELAVQHVLTENHDFLDFVNTERVFKDRDLPDAEKLRNLSRDILPTFLPGAELAVREHQFELELEADESQSSGQNRRTVLEKVCVDAH